MRIPDRQIALRALRSFRTRVRGEVDVEGLVELGLRLGRDVYLAPGVLIDYVAAYLIEIDDEAVLAPRAHVLAHDASTRYSLGYTRLAPVYIGKRAFIGAAALVLPGSTIGDGAIIGAGSLVTGDIPPGMLAKGRPARVVSTTEEYFERRRTAVEKAIESGLIFDLDERLTPEGRARIRALVKEAGEGFIK